MLLVTHGHPTMVKYRDPHLGRLVQPRHYSSIEKTAEAGIPWAADNDAFNGWDETAEGRFLKMLDRIEGLPGCLFVTAPDVVGDALATWVRFDRWHKELRERGLPIAFVAQDGFEELGYGFGGEDGDDWDFECLFIGGTTEFKLGEVAKQAVADAKALGKWVHMGRVNSLKRMRYAQAIGCDSVDGTKFSMFADTWIPEGIAAMKGGRQMFLESEAA